MSRPSLEDVVRALAGEACRSGHKLLVLKNYEWLPQANRGRDIDLLGLPGTEPAWHQILDRVGQQLGLRRSPARRYFYCEEHVLEGLAAGPLQIDLIGRLHWRGLDWMSPVEVWTRAVPFRDGIWIPAPADHCVFTFCQSYLHGGLVVDRHVPQIVAEARKHAEEVLARFAFLFGPRLSRRILADLQHERVEHLRARATLYRLAALMRGLVRHPIATLGAAWVGYRIEWQITAEQINLSRRAKDRMASAPGAVRAAPRGELVPLDCPRMKAP